MLNNLDWVVIALYLVITLAIGLLVGRRIKTGTDLFLAGRSLPGWAVGMSLVATDIGGTDIIGVGGAAYLHGLAVANFEWIGCVPAMIVGGLVFVPLLYRTGVFTVPEYLERRYNVGVRTVLACCWLAFMACNLGIMLLASGKLMQAMLGWDLQTSILVTAVLVGTYTCAGGLAAVVYTDVVQCTVMIAGCLLVLVLGLMEVGGVEALRTRLEQNAATVADAARLAADDGTPAGEPASRPRHTQLLLPVDTPTPYPWTGIYFGLALVLSPAYWIGNQAILQRSLGARSEYQAKASYIWGALLKNIVPIVIAVPGLIALATLPVLEDGDLAIPTLIGKVLPSGLRGMFVAAFLAALMSSIDSYLNSAATLFSHDIFKRHLQPQVTGEALLRVGRLATLAFLLWAVLFAGMLTRMQEDSGIYALFQTLMAFFQGPAFAVLITGMLWKRASGGAALIALLVGIAVAISLYSLNQPRIYTWLEWRPLFQIQEPFLYFSIWSFLTTLVLLVVLSYMSPPPALQQSELTIWSLPRSAADASSSSGNAPSQADRP